MTLKIKKDITKLIYALVSAIILITAQGYAAEEGNNSGQVGPSMRFRLPAELQQVVGALEYSATNPPQDYFTMSQHLQNINNIEREIDMFNYNTRRQDPTPRRQAFTEYLQEVTRLAVLQAQRREPLQDRMHQASWKYVISTLKTDLEDVEAAS